jgi:hypothetical protein
MAEEKEVVSVEHQEKHSKSDKTENSKETQSGSWKDYWHKFNAFLEKYLLKEAPAVPQNAREVIVLILPYLILIGATLSIIFGLFALIVGGVLAFATYSNGFNGFLNLIFSFAIAGVEIFALPGLFAKQKRGWDFLYYSILLSIISSILTLSLLSVIFGVVSLYLTFQIKSYYKK